MITMEQKIDIILRYLVTDDEVEKNLLKAEAFVALNSEPTPEAVLTHDESPLDDIVEGLLDEIGVPYHLVGRAHLHCAIKLLVSDKKYADAIVKCLYPAVAEHCSTTGIRVERGIRHAISCVWTSRDLDNAHAIFGNTINVNSGKPTNSEFLAACVNEVKHRMKYMK